MEVLKRPFAIVALVLAVLAGAVVAGRFVAADQPAGYGPELEASVVAACARALGAEDDSDDRCSCVYDRLAETLPFSRLVEEADVTARTREPTAPFVAAAAACEAPDR